MARTWLELSQSAFYNNIQLLQKYSGSLVIGLVVKSNAYGHGLREIVHLVKETSLDWLFVSIPEEALILQEYGWDRNCLLLSFHKDHIEQLLMTNCSFALYDYNDARLLQERAAYCKMPVRVHIKIDTGLGRLGLMSRIVENFIEFLLRECPLVRIEGLFTQLADTFQPESEFTFNQLRIFQEIVQKVTKKISIPYVHGFASGGFTLPEVYRNSMSMIRVGAHAYGLWKSDLQKEALLKKNADFKIRPILTWKTNIHHIKYISANESVGYNRTTFITNPTKIGILPVGYSDGYPRTISEGNVILKEYVCPIIGTVCMNMTMINISHVPDRFLHEDVLLLGPRSPITASDIAAKSHTISLEILSRIHSQLPRTIVE